MRRLWVAVVLMLGLLPMVSEAGATAGALPSARLLFDSDRTDNYEIWAMDTDGGNAAQLTDDDRYDSWWPRLSPDRTRVLFYRTPAGTHDRDYTATSLWVMDVDGTGVQELVPRGGNGWELQGHGEWSPDGSEIVMFAGPRNNPQIWVTAADGTNPRQLTQRGGTNLDPSWRPDGEAILFIGCPIFACMPHQYEVYEMASDGSSVRRLTVDMVRDQDPYYSPDGTRIAWLRNNRPPAGWSIFKMAADGSGQGPVIEDPLVNSLPRWSADSSWIWFHRTPLGHTRFNIFRVRPDGSDLVELNPHGTAFAPYDNEFPSP